MILNAVSSPSEVFLVMNIKKLMTGATAVSRAVVVLLAPVLALCALALPARAALPRPDPAVAEFARGVKFTVAGYTGTEVLTNFPVLVRLKEYDSSTGEGVQGFLYSDFNYTDGADLCFIDMETNGIPYEIDTWNRSGESLVWVTLPRVTNGTEFVMWYHSVASGAATVSTGDPWRDYTGVWHMNDTANTGVLLKDSTTNGLGASVTSGSFAQSNGRIGGSRIPTKTGTSKDAQCIEVSLSGSKKTAVDNLNTAENGNKFSVALWVKPEKYSTGQTNPQSAYLVGRKVADGDGCWAIQYHYDSTSHYNMFRLWASETSDKDVKVFTVDTSVIPNSAAANGNWYKLYVVYNGKTMTFYVNGNAYSASATAKNPAANGNNNLFLAGTSGTGTRDFRGEMDEVRLRAGVSSADWVKADYDTVEKANFLLAGKVETVEIVEKPVFGVTLDDFGASHAQFTATVSSLGASTATSCTLKAKVWPTSGTEPAAWTEYASNLGQDVPATFKIKGLSTATPYSYKIIVVNNEGVEANEISGTFTTAGVGVAGTGGDVTRVGDDWIHYFRVGIDDESGDTVDTYTFAPPSYASTVRALVVAGGGPGGYQAGGGGGAGGYIYDAALVVSSASAYTVNVGAGGVAATSHDAYGSNGGDSSIVGGSVNVVAVGGGAGGNGNTLRTGVAGGSGGGSSLNSAAAGTGNSGQGNAGGVGNDQTSNLGNRLAGGGGGAGALGGDATLTGATVNPGGGGKGAECDITGVSTWYAGGGGGGGGYYKDKADAVAGGGLGGGGAGSRKPASGSVELAGDGVDGLGGGGGGGSGDQSGYEKGGDGGDGIVIIRYASQGDPSTIPEPIVSLQTAVCNDTTFTGDVAFRVAWAGYGCETADVKAVWGYAADSLNHTNDIATGVIGLGSGAFPLKSDKRTVYVRLLAVNGNDVSALSSEALSFYVNENEKSEEEVLPSASDVGMSHIDSAYATVTGLVVSAGASHSLPSNCTVRVLWGTSPSSLNHSAEGTFEVGAFSLNLEGLAPETTYYYDVELIDDEGNAIVAVSGESFTTLFPLVHLTMPSPLPANVTLVSVTTNGVAVTGNAGVYTVFSNATVVATFAAESGYCLVGDATVTITMTGDTEIAVASIPNAEQNPEVVAPEVSKSATKVSPRKTVTLTASAPGATSYRWLKNGEQIEEGTSGTLTVNWRMPKDNPIDTYRAVALYLIDSLLVESDRSEELTVENRPMGTVITLGGPLASPVEHDYSADYLTFRVLTSGTISWKSVGNVTNTIEYSINNGEWTSITATSNGVAISAMQGDLVRFRANNTAYATSNSKYSGFEGGTATYDIEGNIMSLLYGDNFSGSTTLPEYDYIFCSLFKKAPVVSAENLVLPATTLKTYCYRSLFSNCTTLTNAPALPATTLAKGCYWYMFEKCAITEAPALNATTLVNECYGYMFTGCSRLAKITCLATSGFGASKCLEGWVKNVAGVGEFAKASNVSSWTTGINGIPSGWVVSEDVLLLPPELSFDGETIELECGTVGAEIHYRLGQTGDFALYTEPISIVEDTTIEAYSTCQDLTSPTVAHTCVYAQVTPFQRSNKDLRTWRYDGNTITTPYSVNAIDGHSQSYSTGTFSFDTSITLSAAQPTYLWFQHADQSADIYVNNVKVGTHWGGYNAFFFDISGYVHAGRNDIRVALCNTTRNTLAPYAGDFNFNATLGNVKLFTSPVLPAMEYGYDGFHVTSTVSSVSATVYVETKVPVGADLKCIISDNSYAWTNTLASTGNKQIFTTTISNPHLWNGTLDPHLYTVTLEISKDGELYHRYQRPYGLRYYEYVINQTVQGENYTGFLLNGRPYQLRGVCMHDDVEGKANALTDSDYDQEFDIIQELGCNFIRLAHYPHPKEVYDRCDQLGIVVQTEVPCVNNLKSAMPEDYYTHLATQYIEMVQQHYNHPCIVFWGLSNETVKDDAEFGKEKIDGYYDLIKGLDSERMVGYVMSHSVDDPSGYYNDPKADWFGCNIYVGWYIDKSSNNPSPRLNTRLSNTLTRLGKPLAFSEYGCGGTPHCHSENFKKTTTTGNNPRHDIEYQMWLHEGHIAAIRNYPQLLFTGEWQLFDIAVANRNEGFTECIDGINVTTNTALSRLNNKGLVERDHVTKKDTFYLYKAEWNSKDKFVHICGKDYTKVTSRKLKCYTNDGNTLSLYNGQTLLATAQVTDHIAEFEATDFTTGVVYTVRGDNSSDTVTFQ